MLSPDITTMVTLMDMAMVTDTMVMERGKPRPLLLLKLMLSQVIIIMATLTDMVTDMAIMDMVMVVMDTMVKQYLFISFSKISCIHWNLLESSQQKHRPLFKKNKNSFFEIKSTKLKK